MLFGGTFCYEGGGGYAWRLTEQESKRQAAAAWNKVERNKSFRMDAQSSSVMLVMQCSRDMNSFLCVLSYLSECQHSRIETVAFVSFCLCGTIVTTAAAGKDPWPWE